MHEYIIYAEQITVWMQVKPLDGLVMPLRK